MLRLNRRIYILGEIAIRVEILRRYYNNLLAGYLNNKKIYKILKRKYV